MHILVNVSTLFGAGRTGLYIDVAIKSGLCEPIIRDFPLILTKKVMIRGRI